MVLYLMSNLFIFVGDFLEAGLGYIGMQNERALGSFINCCISPAVVS